MSKNAFALSLDKTATVIQHIVEERNKPGFDLLCKVFEVYPNVSKDWLLQGTGSMFPFTADTTTSAPAPTPVTSVSEETAAAPPAPLRLEPVPQAAPAPVEAPAASPIAAVPAPVAEEAPAAPVIAAAPAPVAPAVPPAPVAPAPSWEAMLYAQQLQHQLALVEQRNQHLLEQQKMMLEQQRMMQQMMEMLRPAR